MLKTKEIAKIINHPLDDLYSFDHKDNKLILPEIINQCVIKNGLENLIKDTKIEPYKNDLGYFKISLHKEGISKQQSLSYWRTLIVGFNISYFPGNCSWLIGCNIEFSFLVDDSPTYAEKSTHTFFDILESVAYISRYSNVFVSHNTSKFGKNFLDLARECGYEDIHNNINYHSDNEVFLLKKDIDEFVYDGNY